MKQASPLDLSTPSVLGLAFILRHRELWPKDFKWDYGGCLTCAIGLACELWGKAEFPHSLFVAEMLKVSVKELRPILLLGRERHCTLDVTPEMIASDLEVLANAKETPQ